MKSYSMKGLLVAFGFMWSFGLGIFISRFFLTPTRTEIVNNEIIIGEPLQKEYFLMAIVETSPRYVFSMTYVDRYSKKFDSVKGYAHLTSYSENDLGFRDWSKAKVYKDSLNIEESPGLSNLENKLTAKVSFDDAEVDINIPSIITAAPIRSQDNFSKFYGVHKGNITINGNTYPAKFAFSKGFNDQSVGVDVLDVDASTDWFMYWEGESLVHYDHTNVLKDHPSYKSHEYFGVYSLDGKFEYIVDFENNISDEDLSTSFSNISNSFTYGPVYYSDSPRNLYKTHLLLDSNSNPVGLYLKINK